MLVTVISVAYNSEATIGKTIESVLNQTYHNLEYIIVDGLSTDNTVAIAKSYIKAFEDKPGRAIKILSEKDNGMYDALNKGIAISNGEIIGSINTDDWYELDAVEKMVKLYKKEKYDVAWGSLNVKKPSGDTIKHAKIGKLWTTTGWCHPAMFATRAVLKQFPYACESMYDDFDFITAVHKAKKKIITLDEVISNFSFGGMSTQKDIKEVCERIRIRYNIYKKYEMSRLYWFYCVIMEFAKYLMS